MKKSGIFDFLPEKFRLRALDSGKGGAVFSGSWNPDDGFDYDADITINDASGILKDPEVAFFDLNVQAGIAAPGKVTVTRAGSRFWEGEAGVTGSFDITDGTMKNPDFDIHVNGVAKNDTLMAMLPEPVRKGVLWTGPSNMNVGGDIRLVEGKTALDLNIYAQKLAPFALPFVFDDAEATIRWASGESRVRFENMSGYLGESPVNGFGALLLKDDLESDFTVSAEDVAISPELLDWLSIDTGRWEIDGGFDIELQARNWRPVKDLVIASLDGITSEIYVKDMSCYNPDYGQAAKSVYGKIDHAQKRIDFTSFNGDVFGVNLDAKGRLLFENGQATTYLELTSETFFLTPELLAGLPFETGLEDMDVSGSASFAGILEGNADEMADLCGDITARLNDVKMTYSETPVGLNGSSRLRFCGNSLAGSMHLDDITIADITADRLDADFVLDFPVLDFQKISIDAYGGRIESEALTVNVSDKSWQTEFDISQMNIESIAGSFGVMEKEAPQGMLRAEVSAKGESLDTQSVKGRGEIAIEDGRLYSFPVLVAVLSVFDLKMPTQNPVTDAYGSIAFENGVISIEDLFFTGGSMPIYMKGHIGWDNDVRFKDQPVNLIVTITKKEGILDRIPIINILKHYTIDLLRSFAFRARVTGTLGDYKVSSSDFPGISP